MYLAISFRVPPLGEGYRDIANGYNTVPIGVLLEDIKEVGLYVSFQ